MRKFLFLLSMTMVWIANIHAVTFKVTVPDGTPKCFVCGDFNNWDATNCPQMTSQGNNTFILDLPEVTTDAVAKGYKYLCGQDWKFVEKDAKGDEIGNRTSIGNPDVVESWANLNLWDIKNVDLVINGVSRKIDIYTPKGYEDSSESYPVIYYNTVQQRYSKAGDDNDNGDNLFSSTSWNAPATMENMRATTNQAYIMVQITSMLGENTIGQHSDFKGTGNADLYLESFVKDLIPYIEKNYRVKSGSENSIIMGADFGALFSLYAAVMHPEIFGCSIVMSPMLWINEGMYEALAAKASANQTFYLSAGDKEPKWMITDTSNLADILNNVQDVNAYFTIYENAAHHDDDWGVSFQKIIEVLPEKKAPAISSGGNTEDNDGFSEKTFILYAGPDKGDLKLIGEMVYAEEYYAQEETQPTQAFVITYPISTEYKKEFFWNVKKDNENGAWLLSEPKSIGFSSSKTETSWHNVAVYEDETTHNIAAHSKGFRVINGSQTVKMEQDKDYVSKATVKFGDDKSFVIKFGSVNSNSLQSALTPQLQVSENCTQADIFYDFNLNKVTIEETVTSGGSQPEIPEPDPLPEFRLRNYTIYGGENADNLNEIGKMAYSEDFRKMGSDTPVNAFIFTNDIPASFKSVYYWNIKSEAGNWVLTSPKTITFSDKKTETSWHTIALYEDGSISDVAAHSKGFRLVSGNKSTLMESAGAHQVKLSVNFPTTDKSFQINYGSVNSASDMGAMTPLLQASPKCLSADITYDFSLNKVDVVETKQGDPTDNLKVTLFSAMPAVAIAGDEVKVSLKLNKACDGISLNCKQINGNTTAVTPNRISPTEYTFTLNNLSEGIYTLNLSLTEGATVSSDVAPMSIRVLAASERTEKELSVNAYEDIDWKNTGRYKANFHTHTSQSFDTNYTTTEVVDKYQAAGYHILALTDHDANSYPWNMFNLYNPNAQDRDAAAMGMLSIPGNELSKDRRNSWSESTGGEFNHHNDFFTGRKGQEFMSLRESYAYTQAIGGLQIINHPGQYWNLSTEYKNGAKNSPEWHAQNFKNFDSLIGLEVYNQGNRRPNDRILWDQILTITMPERPVWGYSCDDTHTAEQYFRNYQYMLMPQLSVDALKDAMIDGTTVFSYEFTGSGLARAPHIYSIEVDKENHTITIDTDDSETIEWIYSTYRTGTAASTTKSAIVGYGNTFNYSGFQGSYVRARLTNAYGETATQPFGFTSTGTDHTDQVLSEKTNSLRVINNLGSEEVTLICTEPMQRISLVNSGGAIVRYIEVDNEPMVSFNTSGLPSGVYVVVVATPSSAYTEKIIK